MTPLQLPNFFDMLQHAVRHFRTEFVGGVRQALPLLVAIAVLLTVLEYTLARDARWDMMTAGFNDRVDLSAYALLFVIGAVSFVASIAFLGFVFTASYAAATGSASRGAGFKLGTGPDPMFQVTLEQETVIRSSLRRIVSLWPALPFALLYGVAGAISMQINAVTFGGLAGDPPPGAVAALFGLRVLALVFGLWFAARIMRFYLYRPAVVVETGMADEAAIDSAISGKFPGCVFRKRYGFMLILVVLGFAIPSALDWVWNGIVDVVPPLSRGMFGLFLNHAIGYFGWVLSAIFLAGCISFLRGQGAARAGVDTSPARGPDGIDTPAPTDPA